MCSCVHPDYFDAGLWCLSPVDRSSIQVSDALIAHRPAWAERQGAKVRMPSHHTNVDNWPSTLTLQVQVDFMAVRKLHRLNERKSYPFACGPCGSRFMTKGGFAHHGRYCVGRGHLKPSQFHTPLKQPKQRSSRRRGQQTEEEIPENKQDSVTVGAVDSASAFSASSRRPDAASSTSARTRSSSVSATTPIPAKPASTRNMRSRNKPTQPAAPHTDG